MNFFFQAEDGIRDSPVTGVQTCALPISGKLAYLVEMSTPLLLNAMIRNKMKNPGIKLV